MKSRILYMIIGALIATLTFCVEQTMTTTATGTWIGVLGGLGIGLSHEALDKWLNRFKTFRGGR